MIHPHVHSDYSNYGMQDSVNRIDNIIKRVKELGQTSWCLTDHNTCAGITDAYKKSRKAGLKLIPGAELYLTADLTIQQRDLKHITFWAKTYEGLQNLNKLTTEAHGDRGRSPKNYYYKSRVDLELIQKYSKGLMCGSACLGGFLRRRIEKTVGDTKVVTYEIREDLLQKILKIFPNDFFLELHTYQCEEQYEYNRKLVELSQRYDLPLIAATDAHFTWRTDADLRQYFKNTSKTQEGDENVDDTLYLQSEDEIRENLKYLPSDIVEASIANTEILGEKSNVEIVFGQKFYPHYPCENPLKEVTRLANEGWKVKVKDAGVDTKVYRERVKYELEVLDKQDYCSYFLITHDYVDYAAGLSGVKPPGRGSVVACKVAELMGITTLDPIKYNLPFERFAHNERIAPPDIDCDVPRKYRGKVIDYIRSKYGEVLQCRTFQTEGAKGSIRRAGDALGWPKEDVDVLAKSISKYEPEDDEEEDLSTYEQKLWILDHVRTDANAELIDLAKRFVGLIKGVSKHASAVIVLDNDITRFCSVERQMDSKTKEPCYVAACSFPLLEEQGLMKADVLGLKTLDVIADTIALTGEQIDINNIPLDDPKTLQMLCEGGTSGCFQIESPGMTHLVKQIKPQGYADLIPLVALYRPGCLNAIVEETGDTMVETYVKVRNGEIEPTYLHPKLKNILGDTYSIILYQEQLLEIAKELCGYSLGEADVIRRIVGKKKMDEMKPAVEQMIERGVANGVSKEVMEKITKQIVEFAAYSFNKGHSAAYGFLAYQTAYLKAHYPIQFMCATINSEEDKHDKIIPYINECKRLGIPVLPPDVRQGNREWVIEGNSLRIGLHYVKGIGNNLKLDRDILKNPKNVTTALIKAGAVDHLGERKELLEQVLKIDESIQSYQQKIAEAEQKIIELTKENESKRDKTTKVYQKNLEMIENRKKDIAKYQKKLKETLDEQKLLQKYNVTAGEYQVLGFSFNSLPKVLTGKLTRIHSFNDRNKHLMAFLTWSTIYGEIESTVFWESWSKLKDTVKQGETYDFVQDSKGILQEIKIGEQVFDFRRKWRK